MLKPFCGIRHRAANFYNGDYTRRMNISTVQVLGDGEVPIAIDSNCNDVTSFPDGLRLWQHILDMVYGITNEHMMHTARYHQQAHEERESNHESKTIAFPGHLDKAFVTNAIFVPLTRRDFFTFIAVPTSWYVQQNENANQRLEDWMTRISEEEGIDVFQFLQKFKLMAEIYMKVSVDVRVYFCSVGSVLVFPANICFHTTLTPGTETTKLNNPRDLFIIHTTSNTKR